MLRQYVITVVRNSVRRKVLMERISYSLKELCRAADVTERTVRYYIAEGLLPPASGSGPFSRYGYEHWLRLQFIRRLKEEYLPLNEIKNLLADKPLDQLEHIARRTGILEGAVEPASGEEDKDSYLESLLQPGRDRALQFLHQQIRETPPAFGGVPLMESSAPEVEERRSLREDGTGNLAHRAGFTPSAPGSPPVPASYSPPAAPGGVPVNFVSPAPVPPAAPMAAPPPSPMPAPPKQGGFLKRIGGGMPAPSPAPEPASAEADEPVSQSWERIVIAPGIELHVESSIATRHRAALNLLVREVRRLFGK